MVNFKVHQQVLVRIFLEVTFKQRGKIEDSTMFVFKAWIESWDEKYTF